MEGPTYESFDLIRTIKKPPSLANLSHDSGQFLVDSCISSFVYQIRHAIYLGSNPKQCPTIPNEGLKEVAHRTLFCRASP